MKFLLRLLVLMLVALNAQAQWYTVTNVSGTTAVYGPTSVYVSGAGTYSTYPGWCGAGPYWIGDGSGLTPDPGSYTFTFTPNVTSVKIFITAADVGESISIDINGTKYHLTAANLIGWSGGCFTGVMTLSGDTLISTGADYSAELVITSCPINSITVATDGLNNGSVFTMMISDSGSCSSAVNNGPCQNDTLKLDMVGDSTGATYLWYGPGGFTSTLQNPFIYPALLADSGVYTVIKTIVGVSDTDQTDVVIRPQPIVIAGSNSPICSGYPLLFIANPDSVSEIFTWTGPDGFTSSTEDPSILNASTSYSGFYKVVTALNGCYDSTTIRVAVDSTPQLPAIGSNSPLCSDTGTLMLTSGDKTSGISYYSWSGPSSFTSSLQNPSIPDPSTGFSGIFTVTVGIVYTAPALVCSNSVAITVTVDSTPLVPVLTSNAPICSGNTLNLTAMSSSGTNYKWGGPNAFTTTTQNPAITAVTTAAAGIYSVTVTSIYPGITCFSIPATATFAVEVDSTPVKPVAGSNSPGAPILGICVGDTLKFTSSDTTAGVTYAWTGPASFTSVSENPEITNVTPSATGAYTLTVTLDGKCSAATVVTVSITPTPPLVATSNSPVCSGDTLALQAQSDPGVVYNWTGPYTFSSSLQNPSRIPAIMEYAGIYHVYATLDGCPSATVSDTVVMRQTPPAPWVKWMTLCQNYDAYPLQAYGENILWYKSAALPLVGTPVPPIPATSQLGIAYYYATQTVDGCISAVDSIQITVYPTPVLTVTASIGVCPHDSAILKATSTSETAYYHWFPALYLAETSGATVTARPENDITYRVVVSNEFGCADTGHVSVTVNSNAVITLPLSATIYPGETYQISPQTNCSYFSWFPPQGLDHDNISNPVASPEVSTKYTVQGTTAWGCTVNDSIDIIVDPNSLLAVPNAFTPGNGPNNEFKIIVQGKATLTSFNIFDRWGNMVFSTTDINAGWDGMYKGASQPFGVYVYEISAMTSTGQPFIKTGNLTLVR